MKFLSNYFSWTAIKWFIYIFLFLFLLLLFTEDTFNVGIPQLIKVFTQTKLNILLELKLEHL